MAKKKRVSWLRWFPVVLGIVMTPIALRAASVLALSGPDGLILLYPCVQILKNPLFGIDAALSDSIAQWMMYLQFPLYGLLMVWLGKRGLGASVGAVALLHAIGIGAAILLAHWQNPSLRFVG